MKNSWNQKNIYGETLEETLMLNSIVKDGCRIWIGAVSGTSYDADQYGTLRWDSKVLRAHVISYEITKGPIPKDLEPHHICKEKLCIEPKHLKLLTHAEHMQEHYSRTTNDNCIHGHSLAKFGYLKPNKRTVRGFTLSCRECVNIFQRARKQKQQNITRVAKA